MNVQRVVVSSLSLMKEYREKFISGFCEAPLDYRLRIEIDSLMTSVFTKSNYSDNVFVARRPNFA